MESFQDHLKFLYQKAIRLRIETLKAIHKAGVGHVGSALSAIDIVIALYHGKLVDRPVMYYDPKKPGSEEQDYFVMSKGQGCPAWYAVLADLGFFNMSELDDLFQANSLLQGHPLQKIPGVSITSGSLGHGFSAGLGLAMSLKADRQPNRVFCMVGEGELQEGQIWEGAMAAAHYKLDNFTLIVDWNGLQIDGPTRAIMNVDPIADKFEAFGWKVIPVHDGHDFEEILSALDRAFQVQRRPAVIIARTIKGKGVSFAENKPIYHAVALSEQEMAEAIPKLEAELQQLKSL